MRLIKLKLQDANMGEFSNVQLVLTGGTANLPGLAQLATQTITNRVRIGVPDGRTNVPQELKAPSHSTGVGILLWAMKPEQAGSGVHDQRQGRRRADRHRRHLLSTIGASQESVACATILIRAREGLKAVNSIEHDGTATIKVVGVGGGRLKRHLKDVQGADPGS